MNDILSKEQYVPPEVDVLQVQVERGFYVSGGSSGGGGGYTPPPSGTGDLPMWDEGDPGYWL